MQVFLCIRSSEPPAHFSNPGRWFQPRHTTLRSTTLIVTVGAAGRRSIGRPVEEARNLVEKFPAVSSDTVLIRTTYPICRSSFRLSSGPRNAGCFALFRFSFPWGFPWKFLCLFSHRVLYLCIILNKLFFMHELYSPVLGSMFEVTLSVLRICMGTLVGQAKAVISGRLCSLLRSDTPYSIHIGHPGVCELPPRSNQISYSFFISFNILSLYS